jgi:hypothetical protein
LREIEGGTNDEAETFFGPRPATRKKRGCYRTSRASLHDRPSRGLFAKLDYFDELAGEFETEWMVRERAEAAVIIQSFAVSLENIGVRP